MIIFGRESHKTSLNESIIKLRAHQDDYCDICINEEKKSRCLQNLTSYNQKKILDEVFISYKDVILLRKRKKTSKIAFDQTSKTETGLIENQPCNDTSHHSDKEKNPIPERINR